MMTLTREELKNEPVLEEFLKTIVRNHRVPEHTETHLRENIHIEDFCEVSRCFVSMGSISFSYQVSSWMPEPDHVRFRVDSITFYDTEMEFLSERMKAIQGPNAGTFAERN